MMTQQMFGTNRAQITAMHTTVPATARTVSEGTVSIRSYLMHK
jgi:hypothetical protein